MKNKAVSKIRSEYRSGSLSEKDLPADPLALFDTWMTEALNRELPEPNAMFLATADSGGKPSGRIVLLRDYDENGFVFFTGYGSRKGREITDNPQVSLVFFWGEMERQVRITGRARKTTRQESDRYFQSRPEESRISAVISPQSSVIPEREFLEKRHADLFRQGSERILKRPAHWGGYRVQADSFEFWQGREYRLHDRIQYRKVKKSWIVERLAP